MSDTSITKKGWGLVLPLAAIVSLSACGDDGSEEGAGTCDARDDLQEALTGLADTDVVEGGSEAFDEATDDVEEALDELGSAADETYGDDVDQVQTALDDFTGAVSDGESANDISDALGALASSVTDLLTKVAEEC